VKYSFITQHKNTYPINLQCQVLGVRRQGYYHYRRHTENKPVDPEHKKMLESVKQIASETDYTYGSRRIKKAMNIAGFFHQSQQGQKADARSRCTGSSSNEIQSDHQ